MDKFRSKTDDLAEISDRLYEYLIKRLQIGEEKTRRNIIDLEEYLYKCVDADTIDDVLENQGVPSFLKQVATVECYIDGAIREPCDIWEKDENNLPF